VPVFFGASLERENVRDDADALRGRVVRRRWPLHGVVTITSERVPDRPFLRKLCVRIENASSVVPGERSSALRTAFVSTHTLIAARDGMLYSVLDPPAGAEAATASLANKHTFPVLAGDRTGGEQRSRLVLSSPIILYDFPQVARQSESDTCDATEIDELMMLSVRSLSDRERAEAKATDARSRAIVERAERFGADDLERLHGTLLLDVPALDCVFVDGKKVARGSSVRLHPKRRADIWDGVLEGRVATVRAIHQDVEDQFYVAVTVDDDPASDLHDWYGRSFFFYPDEVTPL
jgi:hypothetical protein